MAQQAHVLYCVEFDSTGTCLQQAWLPAPSLLPPLSSAEVGQLLTVTALCLAVAWGWKQFGRTIRH
jgi:hypothetical protein